MDGYAIIAFLVFIAAYYLTKKKHTILLFLSGVSAGVLLGLILAVVKINQLFSQLY